MYSCSDSLFTAWCVQYICYMDSWCSFSLSLISPAYSTLLKASVIILPLLGLTWVIGLLAVSPYATVFAWIFLFLNAFQVNDIRKLDLESTHNFVNWGIFTSHRHLLAC